MSKKFFRPPTRQVDSEDESEDEEDLSEEEDAAPAKRGANNKNTNADLSSDDDGDDDNEEEEKPPPKSKAGAKRKASGGEGGRKKPKAASFFEEEAEASDDEEEYEDERVRRGGANDGEHMDREQLEMMKLQDRRRAQAGESFLQRTAAEMAADIEMRHRLQARPMARPPVRPPIRPPPPRVREPGATAPAAAHVAAHVAAPVAAAAAPAAAAGGGGSGAKKPRPAAPMAAPIPIQRAPPPPPMEYHPDGDEIDGGADYAHNAVSQQGLVPSVSDPSFWMISCATGKEQEMVMQIMNKCIANARIEKPLGITAAIAAQSKGKIYIESFSEPAVMEAIQNVRGLMQYTMRLVPIGDMTTVMTVTAKKKPVQKNEWVRMMRGHYKGDLALVKEVRDSGLKCIIQCVPRLDLTAADLQGEEARVRRKTVRPPQKFFSEEELRVMGKNTITRTYFPGLNLHCYLFEGNYYKDGYLIKEMTVGSMVKPCTEDDPPTLDELQRFQRRKGPSSKDDDDDEGGEDEGSKVAGSLIDELAELQRKTGFDQTQQKGGGLLIGDTIEVIEGDLIGVKGKIVSLDGSTVKVKPTSTNVTDEVEFLVSQVRKHIPDGTHVKVVDGRYANETGTVVTIIKPEGSGSSADDYTAVIMTDITNKEITVRVSQLRESAEIASGQDKLQGYELYDLVVLSGGGSANEVGVIVRVGQEDFTVVNNHGIAREARPEELRGKKNTMSTKAVALDVQGNHIRTNDSVNIVEGRHKGKTATIKRMNRSQLFLHSQTRTEHAGIFVVKSRSCVLAGSRTQRSAAGGDGGASPWTPQSNQNSRGPGPGRKRDDGLMGKTVRIQAGSYKGFIGTVTDTTGTHVQVELHARLKKVMVTHERVHVVGDKYGGTETKDSNPVANPAVTGLAPTTPFVAAGQTPMHGGATPMHGAAGLEGDAGDEVWRPGGSIDQDSSDAVKENDGWGVSNNNEQEAGGDDNDGWGSSSNAQVDNDWGAPPQAAAPESSSAAPVKQESTFNGGVNREMAAASEMEHDMADNDERPSWLMERVFVTLSNSNATGSIKQIHPGRIVVELESGGTETVGVNDISMIVPKEHDTVLVTGGSEVGLEGTLVCIDGIDAILNCQNSFRIVEFSFLAKVKA